MKKILMLLLATIFTIGCSKNDDNGDNDSAVYSIKVIGSKGVNISNVVITFDGQTEALSDLSRDNWTSREYSVSSVFAASASAVGSDANSTLTLQLLKNGKVIKESTSKGAFLSATISDSIIGANDQSSGTFSLKVSGSKEVNISIVAVSFDGKTDTFSGLSGNNWTSKEYAVSSVFAASVSAIGSDANSTLTLQLLKDGKVIKESSAKGKVLSAIISN